MQDKATTDSAGLVSWEDLHPDIAGALADNIWRLAEPGSWTVSKEQLRSLIEEFEDEVRDDEADQHRR